VRHVRRSCDLSSLTNSLAHSRASSIFPASRKASAFAKAWLSADRSAAESFPDRAPRALRSAADVLRIGPTVQLGFGMRLISTVNASIATPLRPGQLSVSLPRILEEIEGELADVKVNAVEKWRLRPTRRVDLGLLSVTAPSSGTASKLPPAPCPGAV
jgi:hypothetical protein